MKNIKKHEKKLPGKSSPGAPPELPQELPGSSPRSSPGAPPGATPEKTLDPPFWGPEMIHFGSFLVPKLVQKGGTFPKLFPI